MVFLYLWSCLVGMPYTDLGNDKFDIRDKITQKMIDNYPLSLPMIWTGLNSQDPEIKYRSKLILNKKAKWVLFANKIDGNILDIITKDGYPNQNNYIPLKNLQKWNDFCEVMEELGLYDPTKEVMRQADSVGAVWMMWARAKAKRYGKDPCVGKIELPIIRPGQEPKKQP